MFERDSALPPRMVRYFDEDAVDTSGKDEASEDSPLASVSAPVSLPLSGFASLTCALNCSCTPLRALNAFSVFSAVAP